MYQKGIIACVLIHLLAVVFQFALPTVLRLILGLGIIAVGLIGTIFVILLSAKIYVTVAGILFGIGALLPCIGLIVLLVVSGKATGIMKQNGIKVGLLGADVSEI